MTNKPFWAHEKWEEILSCLSKPFMSYLKAEKRFYLKELKNSKNSQRVLDVGSGEGRTIDALLGDLPDCKITGIDLSQPSVASLRQKYAGNERVRIELADICSQKDLKNLDSYDAILLPFNFLGNLTRAEQKAALGNVTNLLKPEGRVLGSVYAQNALEFQRECYQDNLKFRVVRETANYIYCRTLSDNKFTSQRFSAAGLALLLSRNSFELVELQRPLDGFYYLYAAIRKEVFAD